MPAPVPEKLAEAVDEVITPEEKAVLAGPIREAKEVGEPL
jgi:hypothetical protein